MVTPYWIAHWPLLCTNTHSPAHSLPTVRSMYGCWNYPTYINHEDGSCNICHTFGKLSTFCAAYSQKLKNTNDIMFISWMFEWSNACLVLKVTDFLWRDCIVWQSGLCYLQDTIFISLITIYVLSLILGISFFTVCWYCFTLLYFTLYVLMPILLLRTWNVMYCIILRRLLLQ